MLTTPAKSKGIMDTVPFRSSILSIIKIAMIDVNAIVIYNNNYINVKMNNELTVSNIEAVERRK